MAYRHGTHTEPQDERFSFEAHPRVISGADVGEVDIDADVHLPPPLDPGGKSVYHSLQARHTDRALSGNGLDIQEISNILWAAKGVNRTAGPFGIPGLTAASASNSQEIDLYVALRGGSYCFNALAGTLVPVAEGDHRRLALTPEQDLEVPLAPLQLIYVADVDRLLHTEGYREPRLQDPEFQKAYYFVDTGMIAANVYLYAASLGLGAWFHNCDREALAAALNLRDTQHVLFAQSVGYPV